MAMLAGGRFIYRGEPVALHDGIATVSGQFAAQSAAGSPVYVMQLAIERRTYLLCRL
jgi:hypothetical protein